MSAAVSRRAALESVAIGGSAGVLLTGPGTPRAAAAEQDPHATWLRACIAARHQALEADENSPAEASAWARFDALRARILTTPATCLSGSLARLAVIGDYSFGCSLDEAELTPPSAISTTISRTTTVWRIPQPWRATSWWRSGQGTTTFTPCCSCCG